MSDTGIKDDFMKDAAQALTPGSASLFLLIRKMTTDKVLADLEQSLGLAVLAIVSVLGIWPPALYGVEPPEDHLPDALT